MKIDTKKTAQYKRESQFKIEEFYENFFNEYGRFLGSRIITGIPIGRNIGENAKAVRVLQEPTEVKQGVRPVIIKKGTVVQSLILPVCGRLKTQPTHQPIQKRTR